MNEIGKEKEKWLWIRKFKKKAYGEKKCGERGEEEEEVDRVYEGEDGRMGRLF